MDRLEGRFAMQMDLNKLVEWVTEVSGSPARTNRQMPNASPGKPVWARKQCAAGQALGLLAGQRWKAASSGLWQHPGVWRQEYRMSSEGTVLLF